MVAKNDIGHPDNWPDSVPAVDYEKWASDLSSLLDAIEIALGNADYKRAKTLAGGRFNLAEKHGLEVVAQGPYPGWGQDEGKRKK